MIHEKYLFWFRFQYPIDWVNQNEHEVIELVFIIAKSEKEAFEWENIIAEKFIEELLIKNDYHLKKLCFVSFIREGWQDLQANDSQKEIESFPIVNNGEFPLWNL